jgi:hypothetical protein
MGLIKGIPVVERADLPRFQSLHQPVSNLFDIPQSAKGENEKTGDFSQRMVCLSLDYTLLILSWSCLSNSGSIQLWLV